MAVNSENAKHAKIVEALMCSRTISEASEHAGVPERTLYRIMAQEDFVTLYREARSLAVSIATSKLQKASSLAVDTLSEIMEDVEASPSARVSASKVVIDLAFRAYEIEDIESRLSRLERAHARK